MTTIAHSNQWFVFQFSHVAPLASIPRRIYSIKWQQDRHRNFLKIIPAFIWRPTGGELLYLAKPAQNLYFYGHFYFIFQNFKESATEYSFNNYILCILAKFRPKKKKKPLVTTSCPQVLCQSHFIASNWHSIYCSTFKTCCITVERNQSSTSFWWLILTLLWQIIFETFGIFLLQFFKS